VTRPGLEIHAGAVRQRLGDSLPPTCRVLLVGETNPYGAEPEFALYCAPANSAGGRLQRLVLALPRTQYLAIWRANLCDGGFDRDEARARAARLLYGDVEARLSSPWSVIVMLGLKVSEAFRASTAAVERWEPFSAMDVGVPGRRLVYLPHPSGRNAATWGEAGAFERARELVRAAAPELWT